MESDELNGGTSENVKVNFVYQLEEEVERLKRFGSKYRFPWIYAIKVLT